MMEWLDKLISRNKQIENVQYLGNAKLPVDRVLEGAANAGLESCTIIGWYKSGKPYMATSHAMRKDVLWDLCVMKEEILGCGGL